MTTESVWPESADRALRGEDPPRPPKPPRGPWFREFSSLLAVIALVFSFGTTFVSYVRTAQQDSHDRRVELNGLIERIQAITREGIAASVTYTNNPTVITALARNLTQEQLLVAKQAARIMEGISDQVGAAEYALVASVLIGGNIDAQAVGLLESAVKVSRDANDLSGSLRTLASRQFATGDLDQGRANFGKALLVFSGPNGFPSRDQVYVASTHFDTQLFWAIAELTYGSCDFAKQHAAEARKFVAQIGTDDTRLPQLISLESQVATCTPKPSPSPGLIP